MQPIADSLARLHKFVRKDPGSCKVLSEGFEDCKCPRCDFDRVKTLAAKALAYDELLDEFGLETSPETLTEVLCEWEDTL